MANKENRLHRSRKISRESEYGLQITQAHDLISAIVEFNGGIAGSHHPMLVMIINEIVKDIDGTMDCLGRSHDITLGKLEKLSKVVREFSFLFEQLKTRPGFHKTAMDVFLTAMLEYTVFSD